MEKPIVIYTDHIVNRKVCYSFAKGSNSFLCDVKKFKEFNKTIATYGVLRGTYEIIKKVENFYYMDHGYFNQSKRNFKNNRTQIVDFDGYFRVVYNNFIHDGSGEYPDDRFRKLNLKITDHNKLGSYIIMSEPSDSMKKLYNVPNWSEDTINIIRKFSDRKIILHNKYSKVALDELFKNAWAFVSLQSTAGFKAMLNGIPAYFTLSNLKNVGKIEEIENPTINYKILNNLAYGQWTLKEMESGEAWETIKNSAKN